MVSIMKSLNAFDELIKEVSTHKITFAANACTERLKSAVEDLRTFFNDNPGDRLTIQQKYNVANTYALQVEYFLCMYDVECNRRYKERQNAKALYELARQLLYSYADENKSKNSREYFLLVDYLGVAQKYLIASENFVIDMTSDMKAKVEEMSKYIASLARGMEGISVEEYNARSAEAHKNEETNNASTDNNEKSVIAEEVLSDAEMADRSDAQEEPKVEYNTEEDESAPERSGIIDYDL